jgi:hypothetical protein
MRSGRRLETETPDEIEEQIPRILAAGELILLECRRLFDSLKETQKIFYDSNADKITETFTKAEDALRKIEDLQRSRVSQNNYALEQAIAGYTETTDEMDLLAQKESLSALENNHFEGIIMEKGSIYQRVISKLGKTPVFEKDIAQTISVLSTKLRTQSGGLVRLADLFYMVRAANPTKKIELDDVERVVDNMSEQGLIPGMREISGLKIVELVPVTATPDQNIILELATKAGRIEIESLMMETKWTFERATRALKEMEEIGIAKYDLTSRVWLFPVFSNKT